MTEPTLRSNPAIALDERPVVPAVPLRGPTRLPELSADSSTAAPVDGVAVIFFDPESGRPHLVFVSEGLASMVGQGIDALLGGDPTQLFDADGRARFDEIRRGLGLDRSRLAEQQAVAGLQPLLASEVVPGRPNPGTPPHPADLGLEPGSASASASTGASAGDEALPDLVAQAATTSRIEPADRSGFERGIAEARPQAPALPRRRAAGANTPATAEAGTGKAKGDVAAPSIDLDADDPARALPLDPEVLRHLGRRWEDQTPRVFTATHQLARSGNRPLPVHAAYTVIPSMTPLAPYVVAEFRDLEQPSAERLLADQASVVRSLGRGYELGRVCHQVANQVEQELADGSRCWIAVRSGDGHLEPVLAGGLPFEVVEGIVDDLLALGQPLSRRVVAVGALPEHRARQLRETSIVSLWYLPLVDEEAEGWDALRGAMVVATPRERPTRSQARALEHLAAVLDTAVQQATAEAELLHQTLHDPLTGLPNRALLVDRLGQVMARLERDDIALSVLLVDIDRFKTVNDSRGADIGDQVLLEVAARLLAAVRLGDTVGRISSDQYLVLCAATKGELDAKAVARRILRSLSEPIEVTEGDELHITASIGVVVVDEPGAGPTAIISNAESALARATAAGRGRMAVFEADQRHHAVERHIIEQALHRAIGAEELVLHYQPLVEVRTGFMVGAEALIRWDRPGHGMVPPGEFIPIAEESGLIVPLGKWIIDRACLDLGRWPKCRGRSPMITINLGARQLGADTLVPTVVSALRRNGLHPRQVGFEITESMEIRDAEAAVINLNRLKELGCRIAIDDFGIGHATLEYIRRFSMADALKIDKSFIDGLGSSREDTAIVDASVALASSLGLQVVAEGVEDLEQLNDLRDRGVRYAQGFALARPLPIGQNLALWERQRLFQPPWETPVLDLDADLGPDTGVDPGSDAGADTGADLGVGPEADLDLEPASRGDGRVSIDLVMRETAAIRPLSGPPPIPIDPSSGG